MTELSPKAILEAAIFANPEPIDLDKLKKLVHCDAEEVKKLIVELQENYSGRGVELVKVASGYRFQVPQQFAGKISKLREKNPPKYTRAFLETLALIAYRQPITRGEIEEVRGVAVNPKIIKSLQEREWVKVIGHREVPGKPALLGTTKQFLDYFNLRSLKDLPPLEKVVDLDKAEKELTEQLTLAVIGHKGEPIEASQTTKDEHEVKTALSEASNEKEQREHEN